MGKNKPKLSAAEKQRRYREKRKQDPVREAEYQLKHNARNAKRKKVSEMTDREHRLTRKKWKSWKGKSREKQKMNASNELDVNTPPSTPEPGPSINGNAKRGRKVLLKYKSKCVRENQKLKKQMSVLEEIVKKEKRKTEKYKKRLQRLNKAHEMKLNLTPENELTPNSKTKKMLTNLHDDLKNSNNRRKRFLLMKSPVARTLRFHNAMVTSIKQSYSQEKSKIKKHHISSALSSELIGRYRLQMAVARSMGLSSSQRLVQQHHQRENAKHFQIKSFFLSPDVSRLTAGMKETITRKKIKKQRRYLVAPMKTLFQKFSRLYGSSISYTTFTRYRPFFVLKPTEISRDTCLCKQHTNIALKSAKLHQLKLISDKDPHNLYPLIVCDKTNANCMYNMCDVCKTKDVPLLDNFNKDDEVKWDKWVSKKEIREKKRGEEKVQVPVQITSKVTVNGTIGNLVEEFQSEMKVLKKHAFNIKVQNKASRDIKKTMKDNEAVIHADFSENFACKFSEEIQSFHFGGSRQQVSLHTGILYVSAVNPIPFATVSPSKDHGPPAIWAHLKPILDYLKKTYPRVTTVHFFSDGPSSQYKQKNNFYLFSTQVYEMGFENSTWSFFESSHGKGAPDGVGGALKRLANHYVAHGCDIPDPQTFFTVVGNNSKIKMFFVTEQDITEMSKNLPTTPLKTVVGTREIHQVITSQRKEISYRSLSCFCKENNWQTGKFCNCYFSSKSLQFDIDNKDSSHKKKHKLLYKQIYSSDSDEESVDYQDTDEETTMEDLRRTVIQEEVDTVDPEMLESPCQAKIRQGTFVLVDLLGGARKKTKHTYAAVISKVCLAEEDGDYVAIFLIKNGEKGDSFTANESDESIIDFKQVKSILPQPKIVVKGQRVIYQFPFSLCEELK